jgi:hypothetical protein
MNNNNTIAIIGIVAIAALLIGATALTTSQALAGGHHHYKHKHKHHHHHHHSDGQSSSASISQSNSQRAVCISGSTTTGSCNQAASNVNTGNAVAANVR